MTIGEYMRGIVRFHVSDETIGAILLNRDLYKCSDASSLTKREKDLLRADLLMVGYYSASSTTGEKKTHGGFSHTEKSEAFASREDWRRIANNIYRQYGDDNYEPLASIRDVSKKWQPS